MTTGKVGLSGFRGLASTVVSDALDELGLPSGVGGLRPVWPSPAFAGRALTIRLGPRRETTESTHIAVSAIERAGGADVLVLANGGEPGVSCWGGMLSLAASLRGVRGVVVDGACRDIDDAAELGLPVHARAVVPVTARGRLTQLAVGGPVGFGEVEVHTGDIVVADTDGLAFVPAGAAGEVLEAARALVVREKEMVAELRAGASLYEVFDDARLRLRRS